MHPSASNPAASLVEENQTVARLLQLLEQEQQQLIGANIDDLTVLMEEKAQIVIKMAELAKQRYRTLGEAGFEPQESGMQAWIDASKSIAAGKSWTALLELARNAKELNRINGMLIGKHMVRNQNALNVLQGGSQAGSFYGPNGQSTIKPGSRSLVLG
jgi:flagellar biosynthesis protein FlgN